MPLEVKYPDVHVQLTGEDGNALSLVGAVARALKKHLRECDMSWAEVNEEVAAFRAEALSGDYDHVLQTCMAWTDVS